MSKNTLKPSRKRLSAQDPTAAAILDTIEIQKTPDPARRRRYCARSKSTNPKLFKIGVCRFFCQLFDLNEKLPPAQKMTDTEITRQIQVNYPDTKAAKQLANNLRTVNFYRSLYNKGQITSDKQPPLTPSYRYDSDGKPYLGPETHRVVRRVKKGASAPTLRTTLSDQAGLPKPHNKAGRPKGS